MAENGLMSLLFGKKKRKRPRKTTKKTKTKMTKKRIGYAIKKKRVVNVYKFKGLVGRRYSNKNKIAKGKKVHKTKASARKALKKKNMKKTKSKRKTTRRRRSSFGVGGSYMPLSSFMSPYPYSTDSSPPWI